MKLKSLSRRLKIACLQREDKSKDVQVCLKVKGKIRAYEIRDVIDVFASTTYLTLEPKPKKLDKDVRQELKIEMNL